MNAIVIAKSIRKTFGDSVAVAELSLDVSAGEIYGLVGPDGAGKTTTLRLLCGALKLSGGQAWIAGFDVDKNPEQARASLGYLPQRFSLYEELTVLENLRFFAETRGLPAQVWKQRALDILTFVGLDAFIGRKAGQLSGGMKQKLGLAAALVHQPRVLLLDEPTTGVDPVTRQDFWLLIIRLLVEEKVAVVVTTPYMDEAMRCNRIGFMRDGRLLVEGTPAELCLPLQGQILELTGSPLSLLKRMAQGETAVLAIHPFGDRLHVRVKPGAADEVIKRLSERIASDHDLQGTVRIIEPQLEDVFMAYHAADEANGNQAIA